MLSLDRRTPVLVLVLHGASLLQLLTGRCKRGCLVLRSTSRETHEALVLLQCVPPFTDRHLGYAEQMPEFTTGACYATQNSVVHCLLSLGPQRTQIPPVQPLQ
ncbi:hypothetical protein WK80_20510 [Burkholderia multivorans]|nr:hypothetical protein WK80_20510 [Burkholderia multivorans]OXH89838.1 hypothetical protein CA830_16955 [Burkholderia multivorans]OXH91133.1 hypothetical protein CA831_07855 [Burkholderia multivorans]